MSVSQQYVDLGVPQVVLSNWAAFLLVVPGLGMPTIHVVGTNQLTQRSRVSSPLALIHASKHQVVTQSKRVYDLVGDRGPAVGCHFALERLTATWDSEVVADITSWLFDAGSIGTAGLAGRARFVQ